MHEAQSHETPRVIFRWTEDCVVDDVLIAKLFNAFDFGAMRFITSSVFDPAVESLAAIPTTMV